MSYLSHATNGYNRWIKCFDTLNESDQQPYFRTAPYVVCFNHFADLQFIGALAATRHRISALPTLFPLGAMHCRRLLINASHSSRA